MNEQQNPYASDDSVLIPNPHEGFTPISLALGLVGAAAGAVVGYLIFSFVLRQGFYAMIIPGAALGLGFQLAARQRWIGYGVLCAILALPFSLFCEWKLMPFVDDESLSFFLKNLTELNMMTWIMIVIGVIMAFSFGRGR